MARIFARIRLWRGRNGRLQLRISAGIGLTRPARGERRGWWERASDLEILVATAIRGSSAWHGEPEAARRDTALRAQLDDAVREREKATSRLKSLPAHRLQRPFCRASGAAKEERGGKPPMACANATAASSRELGQSVRRLTAELGTRTRRAAGAWRDVATAPCH